MIIPIKQYFHSIAKARAEALDNVLSYLFLSENKESWDWVRTHLQDEYAVKAVSVFNKVPLTHFDGANASLLYESLQGTTSSERLFFPWFTEGQQKELLSLPGSWDASLCAYYAEVPKMYAEEFKDNTYLFSLIRYRTVPLKEVRGLFRLRSGVVIERSEADLLNNGTYISSREYLQYFAGAWHCVGVPFEIVPDRLDEIGQGAVFGARSRALTDEYDWSVHIGLNKKTTPAVSLPSDPLSAKEVFKLRDVPLGKTRRDALKHWVRDHTRKGLPPNYVETHVWPFLRGAEEFTWNGLYCKIQPSQYDLKKAAEYQAIRKQKVAHA